MSKSTIRSIAERLKVAPSTVARALGNDAGVSEKRRQEIKRIADEMGYRPKPFRRKRSRSVGLFLTTNQEGTTDSEFLKGVVFFVERHAAKRNTHIHLAFISEESADQADMVPAVVTEGRVDSVILAGFPSEALCESIKETGIPVVVLHDRASRTKLNSVFLNSEPALKEAMGRLFGSGHRRVALALSNRDVPGIESLYKAYADSCRDGGVEFDQNMVLEGLRDSFDGGIEAANYFMERGTLPDAIIFATDWMALGAMFRFAQEGVKVPEDISIIGHDNAGISMTASPQITTIDSCLNPSVEKAFDLLEKQLKGKTDDTAELVVTAPLLWRQTCSDKK